MLASRYPHVAPVDPELASFYAHEYYIQGYINIAMLTLVLYNACYVAISHRYDILISHRALSTVINIDKEVCTFRLLRARDTR